ncbi:protein-glutamine glutaminase family protein [Streptomyces sp. NPDC004610]|uniref:protein-glutamine glutaminase family protein n=1 Tax=unclassified Streptomyces TaxID=2593676 RepID=UPI0033BB0386
MDADSLNGLFLVLTGQQMPDADPALMRAFLVVPQRELEQQLVQVQELVVRVAQSVSEQSNGQFSDAYREAMLTLASPEGRSALEGLRNAARQLGDFSEESAYQVEYTNLMILLQLALFLVEFAATFIMAIWNPFGAMVRQAMLRALYRNILNSLVFKVLAAIASQQVIQIGLAVAMDRLTQWMLAGRGLTTTKGKTYLTQAVAFGAVAGFVAVPVQFGASWLAQSLIKRMHRGAGDRLFDDLEKALANRPLPDNPKNPARNAADGAGDDPVGGTPRPLPPPRPGDAPGGFSGGGLPAGWGGGAGGADGLFARGFADRLTQVSDLLARGAAPDGVREAFARDMGALFAGRFGDDLGGGPARTLGADWARAFLDGLSGAGLAGELRSVLDGRFSGLFGDGVVRAMSTSVADAFGTRNWGGKVLSFALHGIGDGIIGVGSELVYNAITLKQFMVSGVGAFFTSMSSERAAEGFDMGASWLADKFKRPDATLDPEMLGLLSSINATDWAPPEAGGSSSSVVRTMSTTTASATATPVTTGAGAGAATFAGDASTGGRNGGGMPSLGDLLRPMDDVFSTGTMDVPDMPTLIPTVFNAPSADISTPDPRGAGTGTGPGPDSVAERVGSAGDSERADGPHAGRPHSGLTFPSPHRIGETGVPPAPPQHRAQEHRLQMHRPHADQPQDAQRQDAQRQSTAVHRPDAPAQPPAPRHLGTGGDPFAFRTDTATSVSGTDSDSDSDSDSNSGSVGVTSTETFGSTTTSSTVRTDATGDHEPTGGPVPSAPAPGNEGRASWPVHDERSLSELVDKAAAASANRLGTPPVPSAPVLSAAPDPSAPSPSPTDPSTTVPSPSATDPSTPDPSTTVPLTRLPPAEPAPTSGDVAVPPRPAAKLLNCVILLEDLTRRLHPGAADALRVLGRDLPGSGVRPAVPVDDLALGTDRTERGLVLGAATDPDTALGAAHTRQRLAAGPGWMPVTSAPDLETALVGTGAGSTALVLTSYPTGVGHAFAVHHTSDGPRWIEMQAPQGERVHTNPPALDPGHTRAVLLGPDGRVVNRLPDPTAAPATVTALTDPPASTGYGARRPQPTDGPDDLTGTPGRGSALLGVHDRLRDRLREEGLVPAEDPVDGNGDPFFSSLVISAALTTSVRETRRELAGFLADQLDTAERSIWRDIDPVVAPQATGGARDSARRRFIDDMATEGRWDARWNPLVPRIAAHYYGLSLDVVDSTPFGIRRAHHGAGRAVTLARVQGRWFGTVPLSSGPDRSTVRQRPGSGPLSESVVVSERGRRFGIWLHDGRGAPPWQEAGLPAGLPVFAEGTHSAASEVFVHGHSDGDRDRVAVDDGDGDGDGDGRMRAGSRAVSPQELADLIRRAAPYSTPVLMTRASDREASALAELLATDVIVTTGGEGGTSAPRFLRFAPGHPGGVPVGPREGQGQGQEPEGGTQPRPPGPAAPVHSPPLGTTETFWVPFQRGSTEIADPARIASAAGYVADHSFRDPEPGRYRPHIVIVGYGKKNKLFSGFNGDERARAVARELRVRLGSLIPPPGRWRRQVLPSDFPVDLRSADGPRGVAIQVELRPAQLVDRLFAKVTPQTPQIPQSAQSAQTSKAGATPETSKAGAASNAAGDAAEVRDGAGPLGPDLFGLRSEPAPPPFLQGFDHDALPPGGVGDFFSRLSMTRSAPTRRLAPERFSGGATLPTAGGPVPLVRYAIWLGGPLTGRGAMGDVRRRLAEVATGFGRGLTTVLFTDVPRAAFTAAGRDPSSAPAVHDMLRWARHRGIRLVHPDEIFTSDAPMRLRAEYATEHIRQTGRGYAAASDILRLEIVHRFGGIYLDGDLSLLIGVDPLRSLTDGLADSDLLGSPNGSNDVLVAPRQHRAVHDYLETIRQNYRLDQRALVHTDRDPTLATLAAAGGELADDVARLEGPPAAWDSMMATPLLRTRRDTVIWRTGMPPDAITDAPGFDAVDDTSDGAWNTDFARTAVPPDSPEGLDILVRAAATLVRELFNRAGDLRFTLITPALRSLSDPDAAGAALLEFVARTPDLSARVRSITTHGLRPMPGNRAYDELTPALLPARAHEFLTLDRPGRVPRPRWRLGEIVTDARMLRPGETAMPLTRSESWRSIGELVDAAGRTPFVTVAPALPAPGADSPGPPGRRDGVRDTAPGPAWTSPSAPPAWTPDEDDTPGRPPAESSSGRGHARGHAPGEGPSRSTRTPGEGPSRPTYASGEGPSRPTRTPREGPSPSEETPGAASLRPEQTLQPEHTSDDAPDRASGRTPEQVAAQRLYAEDIARILHTEPLQTGALLTLVNRWSSTPSLLTPDALRTQYHEVTGTDLATDLNHAAEQGRLDLADLPLVTRRLGLAGDSRPVGEALPHMAARQARDEPDLPAVVEFTAQVRDAFTRDDPERALDLLRSLDRDLRKVWAVETSWARRYGTAMRPLLSRAWPAYAAQTSDALGHHDSAPVPMVQVAQWYRQLADVTFEHYRHGTVPVTTGHPEDGCIDRSYLWSLQLMRWGVLPLKVYAARTGGPALNVTTPTARNATPTAPGRVTWPFHVAPVVRALLPDRRAVSIVLDPSLGRGPLTVGAWMQALGMPTEDGAYRHYQGSLAQVHQQLWADLRARPHAWRSFAPALPLEPTLLYSEAHSPSFPFPDQPLIRSWQDGHAKVLKNANRLYRQHIRAQRRELARELEGILAAVPRQHPPADVFRRLRDEVARHGAMQGFLDERPDFTLAARRLLTETHYDRFAALFPPVDADFVPDEDSAGETTPEESPDEHSSGDEDMTDSPYASDDDLRDGPRDGLRGGTRDDEDGMDVVGGTPGAWSLPYPDSGALWNEGGLPPGVHVPLPPDPLGALRATATPAPIRTESFDPRRGGPYEEGRLAGARNLIRFDARVLQLRSGTWVSDATVRVHLARGTADRPGEAVTDTDILSLQERVTRTVHQRVNSAGLRLPDTSVFQLNVEFLPGRRGAHHVVRVHGGRGPITTTELHLRDPRGERLTDDQLLHEFLHFVGLSDRYFAKGYLFRDRPWSPRIDVDGSLTGGRQPHDDTPVLGADDLADLVRVFRTGPVLRPLGHPSPVAQAPGAPARGESVFRTLLGAATDVPRPRADGPRPHAPAAPVFDENRLNAAMLAAADSARRQHDAAQSRTDDDSPFPAPFTDTTDTPDTASRTPADAAPTPPTPLTAINCVLLLRHLLHQLHPTDDTGLFSRADRVPGGPGPRPATHQDDIHIGTRRADLSLLPGPGWAAVTRWSDVTTALGRVDPGSTALILRQSREGLGHAFAAHRIEGGAVRWVEMQAEGGPRVSAREPDDAPGDTLAAVVGPDGSVRPAALGNSRRSLTVDALTDPPATRRYAGPRKQLPALLSAEVEAEQRRLRDVGRDGDCFYHALNVTAQLNSTPAELRRVMADYLQAELAAPGRGRWTTDFDASVDTQGEPLTDPLRQQIIADIRTTGLWTVQAADLTPAVAAFALGLRIDVRDLTTGGIGRSAYGDPAHPHVLLGHRPGHWLATEPVDSAGQQVGPWQSDPFRSDADAVATALGLLTASHRDELRGSGRGRRSGIPFDALAGALGGAASTTGLKTWQKGKNPADAGVREHYLAMFAVLAELRRLHDRPRFSEFHRNASALPGVRRWMEDGPFRARLTAALLVSDPTADPPPLPEPSPGPAEAEPGEAVDAGPSAPEPRMFVFLAEHEILGDILRLLTRQQRADLRFDDIDPDADGGIPWTEFANVVHQGLRPATIQTWERGKLPLTFADRVRYTALLAVLVELRGWTDSDGFADFRARARAIPQVLEVMNDAVFRAEVTAALRRTGWAGTDPAAGAGGATGAGGADQQAGPAGPAGPTGPSGPLSPARTLTEVIARFGPPATVDEVVQRYEEVARILGRPVQVTRTHHDGRPPHHILTDGTGAPVHLLEEERPDRTVGVRDATHDEAMALLHEPPITAPEAMAVANPLLLPPEAVADLGRIPQYLHPDAPAHILALRHALPEVARLLDRPADGRMIPFPYGLAPALSDLLPPLFLHPGADLDRAALLARAADTLAARVRDHLRARVDVPRVLNGHGALTGAELWRAVDTLGGGVQGVQDYPTALEGQVTLLGTVDAALAGAAPVTADEFRSAVVGIGPDPDPGLVAVTALPVLVAVTVLLARLGETVPPTPAEFGTARDATDGSAERIARDIARRRNAG